MKRTYPANIDGQIFYIDEDAFELLKNYLDQLRLTFRGSEGQEIVGDIESRIRELFAERIDGGARVIVLADVNNVIATMGRPEDLSEDSDSNAGTVPPPCCDNTAQAISTFNLPGRKRLYRNMRNKVFGGVLGGFATYLGWNANIMRLLFVIICFVWLTKFYVVFWALILLYMLLWMIIPAATTPQQILEMNGEPVNVDTVGQAVMATAPATIQQTSVETSDGGFFSAVFTAIGKTIMAFLGLIAGCFALASFAIFIATVSGTIAFACAGSVNILAGLDLEPFEVGWPMVISVILAALSAGALSGLMTWGAFAVVFNFHGASKVTVWTVIIVSVMLLVAAASLALIALSM